MVDYTFQENASIGGAINISESILSRKTNSSHSIKFKIGTDQAIHKNTTAEYYDQDGNLILDGKIKAVREISKDLNSDNRILEIQIYDSGYNLIDGNINEIFRNLSPEDIIEDVVTANGLTFVNELPSSSGITIPKKKYLDKDPIKPVNELCNTLGANWRILGTTFYLYRRGDTLSSETIDGNGKWAISKEGWKDDSDKQATRVIIKGATILQRTREVVTGTGTTFILSRTPIDVEIDGFTQTTENITGDYTVDKEQKTIEFNSSQTDPEVFFSYDSQIRVEVGDGDIIRTVEKSYIENVIEARKFGRKYIEIYGDGIQSSKWIASDIYGIDIRDFIIGNKIPVINKLNSDRNGQYIITKIVRKYPRSVEITVGEDETNLYNWQAETKDRVEQLTDRDQNSDFTQQDIFKTGSVKVNVSAAFTHLFVAIDTGDVLWASDTPLASDGDLISDLDIVAHYKLNDDSATTSVVDSQSLANGTSQRNTEETSTANVTSAFNRDNYQIAAYYDFKGNANDKSGFDNDGVVTGASLTTDRFGNADGAYLFDGVNDKILASGVPLSGEFTISYYMFVDSFDSVYRFALTEGSGGTVNKIGTNNDGTNFFVRVIAGGPSDVSISLPSAGAWHLITITRDSNNKVDLYIDNGSANRLFSDAAQVGDSLWRLIGASGSASQYWNGKLDEPLILNKALNSTEVIELYDLLSTQKLSDDDGFLGDSMSFNGVGGDKPLAHYKMNDDIIDSSGSLDMQLHINAVVYYPFDGNANDESVNSYDGTVTGATLTTDRFGNADGAYLFDGVDGRNIDSGDIGIDASIDDFTVSCIVKLDSDNTGSIFRMYNGSTNDAIRVNIESTSGYPFLWIVDSGGTGHLSVKPAVDLNDGNWHYLSVVFKNSDLSSSLWIDGTEHSGTYYQPKSTNRFVAGSLTSVFDGSLDEVLIVKYGLSSNTILRLNEVSSRHDVNKIFVNGKINKSAELLGDGGSAGNSFSVYTRTASGTGIKDQEPWTMSLWTKRNSLDIVSSGRLGGWYGGNYKGPYIFYDYNGNIGYTIGRGNTTGSNSNYDSSTVATITVDEWHHLVLSYDQDYVRFYVDGIEVHNYQLGLLIDNGDGNQRFKIGGNPWDTYNSWNGEIDDTRIYNKALTASDISSIYNNGLGTEEHSDYVDLGTTIDITSETDFSYGGWVKLASVRTGNPNNRMIIGGRRGDRDALSIDEGLTVDFRLDDTTIDSNSIINLNEWTHVFATYKYTNASEVRARIYINGILDKESTFAEDAFNSGQRWIGWDSRFENVFHGELDDIRVFNKELDQDDINDVFNNGVGTEDEIDLYAIAYDDGFLPSGSVIDLLNP